MLIKIKVMTGGGHCHLGIWMGKHEGALGKAGTLCFRVEEWALIKSTIPVVQLIGDILLKFSSGLTIMIEEKNDDEAE